MIAIIDYGSGNIAAIANIYKKLKVVHAVVSRPEELDAATGLILPGVGAFDATMENLMASGMKQALDEQVLGRGKKVMGVCVGMQILAESSEEGTSPGLGWIPGRVRKLPVVAKTPSPPLPHMGWNSVRCLRTTPLFERVERERGFYFLHNFYFEAAHREDILAVAEYGGEIPCAVNRGRIFGMQFHPEKSHANGIEVFRNFAELS